MASWKPDDFLSRRFTVGDLVELRSEAEQGGQVVYRVSDICADGALKLQRLSAKVAVTVAAEDVHTSVFAARVGSWRA